MSAPAHQITTAGLEAAMDQMAEMITDAETRTASNEAAALYSCWLKLRQFAYTPSIYETEESMTITPSAMDWAPNHDERSREYPVRAALPATVEDARKVWPLGPVLNQGRDGACVGYAMACAAAEPDTAERVYSIAKTLDAWPGEAYNGTSVLAGAKAAKALGLIESYRWAFGLQDVLDTLRTVGPVVLGLYWRQGMKAVRPGEPMHATGAQIGGHCTVAFAYDPACAVVGGGPAVCIRNSWGTGWGTNGEAWISTAGLADLLSRKGEACVVTPC